MKSNNTIYFLLLVLLVLGAFASMAQNSYGMTILGIVAGSFSLLFFYRLFMMLKKGSRDRVRQAEVLCLGLLALLIALRILNIHSRVTETIFAGAGLVLAGIYLWKMKESFDRSRNQPVSMNIIVPFFYLSLSLFLLSMITFSLLPLPSFILTILALLTLVSFLIMAALKKDAIVEGEPYSAINQIAARKDQSLILMSMFILFFLHTALSNFGILPKLYSDQFPQAYYGLLKNAESRKETAVDGKFRHDEFKKEYNTFVDRQLKNKE
jgi:hypothetical protein